jgi:hypothetical protein
VVGDDMADKNLAQGKSKKAMTKKARLKKKKVKSGERVGPFGLQDSEPKH